MQTRLRTRGRSRSIPLLVAAVASAATTAYGQTSGTWIPTSSSSVSWNTPSQWSGGVVPNNGGVASFPENVIGSPSSTPTLSSGSVTLSQINIASSAAYKISASSGNGIILPSTGGTINITRSALSIPLVYPAGVPFSQQQLGSQISAPISGGPLTITGGGAIQLTNTSNSYTGGTNISNATLEVLSDAALGATTGGIILNNGTLSTISGAGGISTSRTVTVSGTSAIIATNASTFNGPVTGSGTLIDSGFSSAGITFTASNSFSGNLVEAADTGGSSTGGIVVQGSGAFPNVSNIYVDSYFNVTNAFSVSASPRLNANANVYLDGGIFRLATINSQSVVETINNLNVEAGYSYVGLTNATTSSEGITANNIVESNGASLFLRGGNVTDGSISVAGNENLISVNDPGSIGGGSIGAGGTAGTTTLSIIPWIVAATGNTSASPTSGFFATRNASNGAIRPLALSEMSQTLGNNASDNVYLTEAGGNDPVVPTGGVTCNSVTFNSNSSSGNVSLDSNGSDALTVSSGGILVLYTTTINSPIVFPNGVTGYLQCAQNLTTTNTISGTGGLSKGFGYSWFVANTNNTYSEPTYLNGATTSISGSLPYNASSAFGTSTSPVYLVAGDQNSTELKFLSSSDVDRQIIVSGNGSPSNYAILYGTIGTINFNGSDGSIVLNRDLELAFANTFTPGSPSVNATFNGVISGSGALVEGIQGGPGDSAQILNAANTFSGGTILNAGQFYAGNNSAFGTGPVEFTGGGTIGATSGPNGTDTTRTLANNIIVNSGAITFNNAIPLTLTGSVELNGKNTAVTAYGSPTTVAGNIDSGAITLKAGSLTLSGSNTFTGGVTVTATSNSYPAAITFATPAAFPAYTSLTIASGTGINSSSTAIAASHSGVTNNNLLTSSLLIANNGLLDLTNNDLVVRSGTLATIWGQLQTGYNAGSWNSSTGIISSTAAADTTHLTTLGIMINDTGANTGTASGTALKSSIDGSPTQDGDILVKYTYYGDANLSGSVDGSDYSLIDNGVLSHLTGWYNGDFNYDGVINGSDYTLIDNAFNTQGAAVSSELASPTAQIAVGTSAVPEPTVISLLGICAAGLLGRRRRR